MTRKTSIIILIIAVFAVAAAIDYARFFPKEKKIKVVQEEAKDEESFFYIKKANETESGHHYEIDTIKDQFLMIEQSILLKSFKEIELFDKFDFRETVKKMETWTKNQDSTKYYFFDNLFKDTYTLVLTDYADETHKFKVSLENSIHIKDGLLLELLNDESKFVKNSTYQKSIKIETTTLLKYYKDLAIINEAGNDQFRVETQTRRRGVEPILYYTFENLEQGDYKLVLTDFANQKHYIKFTFVDNIIIKKGQLFDWLEQLPDFSTQKND